MYHGEKFNAWTHLIGALLALTGAVWLLTIAASSGDAWKVFSIAVYGATLVMLYSISTLYHSIRGRAKGVLRKLDHFSIYLLIAGSYTPFCLISLRGPWGWWLFGIVEPLLASLGTAGFVWLAAGGVFYTVGIIFFAFDERYRHWHGIWHLFVIAGSLMHFIAILFYVL